MAREIKNDFQHLNTFIENYNLQHLSKDLVFLRFMSKSHKKYFSYLTFISELQQYIDLTTYNENPKSVEFDFLKESCSDAGSSFFLSLHGSYKASKLILRSSIETFVKGFYKSYIVTIDQETSVFEIFRQIKALPINSVEPQKAIFNSIHGTYKVLCRDVHTASTINMASISALNHFPSFKEDEANDLSNLLVSLTTNYLTLLALKYNDQFHLFHFRNREIILDSIQKRYKPAIHNL